MMITKNTIVAIVGCLLLSMSAVAAANAYNTVLPTTKSTQNQQKDTASESDKTAEEYGNDSDPIEGFNRAIFGFNRVFDGVLLSPLAHIYRGLVPESGQHSVHNVLHNLNSPVVLLNSVLQGDLSNAAQTVARFVVNTTAGIAGVFDVASKIGIKKEREKDFGQTLGVYGIDKGPYLVLPILGPSDVRDGIGLAADEFTDPLTYIFTWPEDFAYGAFKGIVRRADLLPLTDQINRDSLDPYTTYRSIYLQNRDKKVRDYLSDATSIEKQTGKIE